MSTQPGYGAVLRSEARPIQRHLRRQLAFHLLCLSIGRLRGRLLDVPLRLA